MAESTHNIWRPQCGPDVENDLQMLLRLDQENVRLKARIKALETQLAEITQDMQQITAPVEVGGGADAWLRQQVTELEAQLANAQEIRNAALLVVSHWGTEGSIIGLQKALEDVPHE